MHIVGYKDYYDHVSYQYYGGEDKLYNLIRKKNDNSLIYGLPFVFFNDKCDFIVKEKISDNKYKIFVTDWYMYNYKPSKYEFYIRVGFNMWKFYVNFIDKTIEVKHIVDRSMNPKYLFESSKSYESNIEYKQYIPIFKNTYVEHLINPKIMYDAIYEWLIYDSNKDINDTRSNKEHITSNGFDTKTSFRNV